VKNILSILFALVLAVLLTFGACAPDGNGGEPTVQEWIPDVHGQVSFMQLEWMASPEEALYPYSNVGAVEFTFLEGAGDWLLDQHGGGWLHAVIDTTAAGGDLQWAVQNLYLTYNTLDDLLGSTPSVQFSLGLDGETPIEELEAAVFLSSERCTSIEVTDVLFTYPVSLEPYLVGGFDGGGSALSDIPLIIGAWIGPIPLPERTATVGRVAVAAIDEGHSGCAPASAARSIDYLGQVHGFLTDDPQDIYDDLVDAMDTDIGIDGGTADDDMLAGKDSYCEANELFIDSEIVWIDAYDPVDGWSWSDLIEEVQDALDAECDVEIFMRWWSRGGHVAMVTSVTSHADGSATIHYEDDPTQGDGVAENKHHVIAPDAFGDFDRGWVAGFMIECVLGVPPPVEDLIQWIPDVHGEVSFMQLEWMASPGEALYPYSNVGAVEFTFLEEAGDWLLDQHGGGWLNVVIDTTAAAGDLQWAVQNLYLTYDDVDDLLGSTPSVQFSLGLDGETPIESLEAAVFLSSEPRTSIEVTDVLFTYPVSLEPYLVGGFDGGGSALSDIPWIIGPWIGPIPLPDRTASVGWVDIAAIDEGDKGCAPGAAARSIDYLGQVHGLATDDPQDIYDDLVDEMDTDIGGSGTDGDDILDGKNSYSEANELFIDSDIVWTDTYDPKDGWSWGDLIEEVQDALDADCDVEILVRWSGGGGHVAMVTTVTRHAGGSATIHYEDDHQGDGIAENIEHVIAADASGDFDKGWVAGFMIECVEPAASFIDPFLESIIREITGIPERPIYPSDMEVIKKLDASESNITDITGLEHCTDLTELYLGDNQISGISPLANLTSLTYLCLGGNQISDISPLANLTSLTQLKLPCNSISDISPLANLTSLTELVLWDNQISDISPLVQNEGLGTGDYIDLWQNPLSSDSINIYIPELEARGVTVDY